MHDIPALKQSDWPVALVDQNEDPGRSAAAGWAQNNLDFDNDRLHNYLKPTILQASYTQLFGFMQEKLDESGS